MNNYKKNLIYLTEKIALHIALLDKLMTEPASVARGQKLGQISNNLDIANDEVMHFELTYGWSKIRRIKKKAEKIASGQGVK